MLARTREEAELIPRSYLSSIEKSKEKARKLLKKLVAVEQTNYIIVGFLEDVGVDRLFQSKQPFCKLILKKGVRFSLTGNFENKMGDIEMIFVNKAESILSPEELQDKHSRIFHEVQIKQGRGEWW